MPEPPQRGVTSPRLDRVGRPAASRHRRHEGREALYSTAPAAGSAPVGGRCGRCGAVLRLTARDVVGLLRPPSLIDPVRRRVLTRCPACRKYGWITLSLGPTLRGALQRPGRS